MKYFSQDAVIKLAPAAGINLAESLSPAEKLKEVQKLMETPGSPAEAIYRSIGVYLGHTLAFYYDLYHCRHVLLLGRVISGPGGERLVEACRAELAASGEPVELFLPEESFRRVGQASAAALLNTAI